MTHNRSVGHGRIPPGCSTVSSLHRDRLGQALDEFFAPADPLDHDGERTRRFDLSFAEKLVGFPASNRGLRYGSAPHDELIGGDGRDEQPGSDDRGVMVLGNGGGEEQHRA
jgi:hypothetical protein